MWDNNESIGRVNVVLTMLLVLFMQEIRISTMVPRAKMTLEEDLYRNYGWTINHTSRHKEDILITDHALKFIGEQQREFKGKKPFFLYLPFNAPHAPLHALPEDIARYEGRYALGWDSLRQRRFNNAKALGLIAPNTKLAPHDDGIQYWSNLTYYEKLYWQKREEVFAAMIDHVDQSIGRLLAKLKELGQEENTLIVFISDNGAQGGSVLRDEGSNGPIGRRYILHSFRPLVTGW